MNGNANSMRLAEHYGLYIDRSQAITFQFGGQTVTSYKGDTIASALMANGIKVISRSFKYHRPRGVLSMAGQDGNTLVQIGRSQRTTYAAVSCSRSPSSGFALYSLVSTQIGNLLSRKVAGRAILVWRISPNRSNKPVEAIRFSREKAVAR